MVIQIAIAASSIIGIGISQVGVAYFRYRTVRASIEGLSSASDRAAVIRALHG